MTVPVDTNNRHNLLTYRITGCRLPKGQAEAAERTLDYGLMAGSV